MILLPISPPDLSIHSPTVQSSQFVVCRLPDRVRVSTFDQSEFKKRIAGCRVIDHELRLLPDPMSQIKLTEIGCRAVITFSSAHSLINRALKHVCKPNKYFLSQCVNATQINGKYDICKYYCPNPIHSYKELKEVPVSTYMDPLLLH